MALLFLKNLVFPRAKTPPAHPSKQSLLANSEDLENGTFIQPSHKHAQTIEDYQKTQADSTTSTVIHEQPWRFDPKFISDATIGLSDGLTVPFALTAGLSALGDTRVVIFGGLAELIAGSISMGLGGYLGSKSEADAYAATLAETQELVSTSPHAATALVLSTFEALNFPTELLSSLVTHFDHNPALTTDFLMRFHHGLTEDSSRPSRAYISALTITCGYFFGGFVPLVPYFFAQGIQTALMFSVIVMAIALFAFGFGKTILVGEKSKWVCVQGGVQMMVLGGLAAGAAMGIVKALG